MRRVSGLLFTLLLVAASSSPLSAQQSVYMLVDSIKGDQPAPHDREFRLLSFSLGAANPTTISSGTVGMSAGKAAFPPVKVSMRFHGPSSPLFYRNLIAGNKLPSIEIRLYNSTNRMFYKTVFENVFLTNVSIEGSDEALEQIEFTYSRVKWFVLNDPAIPGPPNQVACWDVTTAARC